MMDGSKAQKGDRWKQSVNFGFHLVIDILKVKYLDKTTNDIMHLQS